MKMEEQKNVLEQCLPSSFYLSSCAHLTTDQI
ncbi:MAG: hypothetical protein ACI90V_004581, partial [Bacillariaceae sp.]